jgi:hypothetical protein
VLLRNQRIALIGRDKIGARRKGNHFFAPKLLSLGDPQARLDCALFIGGAVALQNIGGGGKVGNHFQLQ